MSNCVFSFANNYLDYKNLIDKKLNFIFTNVNYGDNCICLNKNLNLYDCFFYLNNYKDKFKYYLYFSSKGRLKKDISHFFSNQELYLNYYGDVVYFVKYDNLLCQLSNLYQNNLDSFNLINFLSDYFISFNYNINKSLFDKFVFPKNKLIYNAHCCSSTVL